METYNKLLKSVNKALQNYIECHVFPEYELNDKGHGIPHIHDVIRRSLIFASKIHCIDLNMVYTVAAYHDVKCHVNRKNHELLSAQALTDDTRLLRFFTNEQIRIMAEAVADHRSSLKSEPRSVYGRIVSSADRPVDVDGILRRTYLYRAGKTSLDENIRESYGHIKQRFGKEGTANSKIYFPDPEYDAYLARIREITEDAALFEHEFRRANGLPA